MAKNSLTRYWHGGVPGLRPGDTIRPAARLRATPLIYAVSHAHPSGEAYSADPDLAYVTTDKTLAKAFAAKALHAAGVGGDLYNVRPRGPLEPDPDYDHHPGTSFTCTAAKIVAVVERGLTLTPELKTYASRFTTWDDGGLMYNREGHALPSRPMREIGLTEDDLRSLGTTPDYDQIITRARWLLLQRGIEPPRA